MFETRCMQDLLYNSCQSINNLRQTTGDTQESKNVFETLHLEGGTSQSHFQVQARKTKTDGAS